MLPQSSSQIAWRGRKRKNDLVGISLRGVKFFGNCLDET